MGQIVRLTTLDEDMEALGLQPQTEAKATTPGKEHEPPVAPKPKDEEDDAALAAEKKKKAEKKEDAAPEGEPVAEARFIKIDKSAKARMARRKSRIKRRRKRSKLAKSSKKFRRSAKGKRFLRKYKVAKARLHGRPLRGKRLSLRKAARPAGKHEGFAGLDRVAQLIEEVGGILGGMAQDEDNDVVKGFANVAMISDILHRVFAEWAVEDNDLELSEAAEVLGQLAEDAGESAEELDECARLDEEVDADAIDEDFKKMMSTLLDGLEILADLEEEDDKAEPESEAEKKEKAEKAEKAEKKEKKEGAGDPQ
jgi:hypothetical protein